MVRKLCNFHVRLNGNSCRRSISSANFFNMLTKQQAYHCSISSKFYRAAKPVPEIWEPQTVVSLQPLVTQALSRNARPVAILEAPDGNSCRRSISSANFCTATTWLTSQSRWLVSRPAYSRGRNRAEAPPSLGLVVFFFNSSLTSKITSHSNWFKLFGLNTKCWLVWTHLTLAWLMKRWLIIWSQVIGLLISPLLPFIFPINTSPNFTRTW